MFWVQTWNHLVLILIDKTPFPGAYSLDDINFRSIWQAIEMIFSEWPFASSPPWSLAKAGCTPDISLINQMIFFAIISVLKMLYQKQVIHLTFDSHLQWVIVDPFTYFASSLIFIWLSAPPVEAISAQPSSYSSHTQQETCSQSAKWARK